MRACRCVLRGVFDPNWREESNHHASRVRHGDELLLLGEGGHGFVVERNCGHRFLHHKSRAKRTLAWSYPTTSHFPTAYARWNAATPAPASSLKLLESSTSS